MAHPFMAAVAAGLAERGIATLALSVSLHGGGRQAPRSAGTRACGGARGGRREARAHSARLPLFAGGKSFGGRMTSQAQAASPLADVRGLVFFGFPLHAAGKPSRRARRASVRRGDPDAVPAGHARCARGARSAASRCAKALGARATLTLFADADHSFHVPARTGRKDAEVMARDARCGGGVDRRCSRRRWASEASPSTARWTPSARGHGRSARLSRPHNGPQRG